MKLDDEEKRDAFGAPTQAAILNRKTPPLKKSKNNKADDSTTAREVAPSNNLAPVITPELLKQLGFVKWIGLVSMSWSEH
ncbi:MAG: hypothetical protein IPJ50_14605 [Betaproteobacteria bacterium]|nr:hypothetical protein [Betaproteobacteria bacterium]